MDYRCDRHDRAVVGGLERTWELWPGKVFVSWRGNCEDNEDNAENDADNGSQVCEVPE